VDRAAFIGVPTSAGTHGPGQEKAPEALRRAGLLRGLEAAGIEARDEGDLPVAMYQAAAADPRQRNLDAVVEAAGRVADRVQEVLGRRPWPRRSPASKCSWPAPSWAAWSSPSSSAEGVAVRNGWRCRGGW
jgi:hypothetical protein